MSSDNPLMSALMEAGYDKAVAETLQQLCDSTQQLTGRDERNASHTHGSTQSSDIKLLCIIRSLLIISTASKVE